MPHLRISKQELDYQWLGPQPVEAPTLVFLHEGLGSVAMWRDFPERVVAATGYGALVYSRAGYGNSDPIELPLPISFMHDEGLTVLPQILDEMNIREAILVGHSDGGSIALIHAGGTKDRRVRGLVLEAPHVFVEEVGIRSITRIVEQYRNGDLKRRLERYHGSNVHGAFRGWHQVWLNPEFRSWNIEEYLPGISVPVLVIQGADDQYGTLRQVAAIQKGCVGPVTTAILEDCGHSPHLDQPLLTLAAITSFVNRCP